MFDGDPVEGAIGNNHAVGAHQPKQTAMKLVSAAFIVTAHRNDLGPDLVLFPGLETLNPSKPDNVFLEAAPCFGSNALSEPTGSSSFAARRHGNKVGPYQDRG
jgi:hypothetical protein